MKSNSNDPDTSSPNEEPRKAQGTMPDPSQRERKRELFAARTGLMAVALMATGMLFAQTTPSTPARTTNNTAHSSTQQPITMQSPKGWTMFDDNMGSGLDLKSGQLQKLQEVDGRYKDKYVGLGETPWTNPGYNALTQQRNADVKSILTPQQYDKWNATYGVKPEKDPTTKPTEAVPADPAGSGLTKPPGTAPTKPAGVTGTTTPPTGKP